MKQFMKRWKRISIRSQFILYFVLIALTIGGSAVFVLHRNAKVMVEHTMYLEYVSKVTKLSTLEEENSKLLREILFYSREEDIEAIQRNTVKTSQLIEELLHSSTSVNISMRFRVVKFLCKRFESQTEEMLRLYGIEQEKGMALDYSSSYYQVYLNLLDVLSRMDGYIKEALEESVQENILTVSKVKEDNEKLRSGLFIISFIIIGLAIFFYFSITNYITRLVSSILEMTKALSKEEHPKTLELSEGPKEVEELVLRFNELLLTMDSLYQKADEKAKLELELAAREVEKLKMRDLLQEARLQGLQLQIQPHFLFNTLNVIAMMAMMEKTTEVYELIIALSKFLRHSLKKESCLVSLEEEIDMVHQYLYIIKARMSEHLCYKVQVQVACQDLTLPLYTLQPIVENAFKHGLEDKMGRGNLIVSIRQREYKGKMRLILRIYDDGLGMTPDILEEIRSKVSKADIRFDQYKHIGIENVAARLRMLYENRVSYQIHSRKGIGTIFTIYIILGEEGE